MATSLILPCYNPLLGWEQRVYSGYSDFCGRINEPVELIIVFDGESAMVTKPALDFLEQKIANLKLIRYEDNRGKGYAIRQGAAAATGAVIMYTDIDFPYTIDSMVHVYHILNREVYDVAFGVKDKTYYSHVPFFRGVISKLLRYLTNLFLSIPVTDTQCGLKGFKRVAAPIFLQTTIDRYLFDLEFIRNCYKNKQCRITPVEVKLNENVHFRSMNYRVLVPEIINFIKLLMYKGK